MTDLYPIFKTAHILGVVLFLGNIIITGWWKVAADRTAEPKVVAFAQRQVTLTDYIFTGGGLVVVLLGGNATAAALGLSIWATPWLTWGVGLFIASGVIWVAILIPCQIVQGRMARGFAGGAPIPPLYWTLNRLWGIFGVLATILPLGTLYFMVAKPV